MLKIRFSFYQLCQFHSGPQKFQLLCKVFSDNDLFSWNIIEKYGHTSFIALCFVVIHKSCVFYKLKARPSTNKKIITHFIAILTLLPSCGTESTISARYTCVLIKCPDDLKLLDITISRRLDLKFKLVSTDWIGCQNPSQCLQGAHTRESLRKGDQLELS